MRERQGKLDEAVRMSLLAIELAESVGEDRALAMALGVHDTSVVELGRVDEATHMLQALEIYERLGDQVHVAITLGNLGGVSYFESKWTEALEYFERSAEAATAAGDLAGAAHSLVNLGEMLATLGRLEDAVRVLEPALRTLESFGFPYGTGIAMMQLGRAQALLGDLDQGVVRIEAAVVTFDQVNVPMASLEARARLAEVLTAADSTERAVEALAVARALDAELGESPMTAIIDRVEVTLEAGRDPARARELLGPALDRARDLGASYDLLVLLTLADRLGMGDGGDEAAAISRNLGVVELVVVPD